MPVDLAHVVLVELSVIGVVLTLYGFITSIRGAKRDLVYAQGRRRAGRALDAWLKMCEGTADFDEALKHSLEIKNVMAINPVDYTNFAYQGEEQALNVLQKIFEGAVANVFLVVVGAVTLGLVTVEAFWL